MRVQFVERENGPEKLDCEAEILFEEEPLAGMKLVGFSPWRGADGEIYVTFPSRAFGAGSDRRFFDYLRSVDGPVRNWRIVSSARTRDAVSPTRRASK